MWNKFLLTCKIVNYWTLAERHIRLSLDIKESQLIKYPNRKKIRQWIIIIIVSSNKTFKRDWGKRSRIFLARVPCIFLPFYCVLISRLMYLSRCNTTVRTVELNSRNVFVHWVKRCAVHACPYIAEICKGSSVEKNLNYTSSFSHWVGFMGFMV
jgi:hypothetical protein